VQPVLHATRARLLATVSDEDLEVCLRVFDALRAGIEQDEVAAPNE